MSNFGKKEVKILTCDSDPMTVELIKTVLNKEGFKTVDAVDGKQCLKKWNKENPDLLLLDILLPDISAWDIYQRIRKKDKKQKVAFLGVIEASEWNIKALKGDGLNGYILKPFAPNGFAERVKQILKNKKIVCV